jgi:hypothetical protein
MSTVKRSALLDRIRRFEKNQQLLNSLGLLSDGTQSTDDKHAKFVAVLRAVQQLEGGAQIIADFLKIFFADEFAECLADTKTGCMYSLKELSIIGRQHDFDSYVKKTFQ